MTLFSIRRFLLSSALGMATFGAAQATTFVVRSNNFSNSNTRAISTGYMATITVTPVSIVAPASCQWGYNYNVGYTYTISYSGNVPNNSATLNNLEASFNCGSHTITIYDLPKNIGSNTLTGSGTTNTNPWSTKTDCATATVSSMGCMSGTTTLFIEGTDFQSQTLSQPTTAAPLPVTLVTFDVRKTSEGAFLAWTTAHEEKGDQYFVERSTDAANWTTLTVVHAASKGDYQYTDREPLTGTHYYRLRNVDAKGVVTYSKIIGVKTEAPDPEVKVFPNPSNGEKIQVTGLQTPTDWNVTVTNTTSETLARFALTDAGLQLPELPKGLYFLRFTNRFTNESKLVRFVKN